MVAGLSVFSLVKAHNKQLAKRYATISFAFLILAAIHYQWYKGGLDEAAVEIIEDLENQQ